MKRKITIVVTAIIIACMVALIVYEIFFAETKSTGTIIKALGILLVYFSAIFAGKRGNRLKNQKTYEQQYDNFIHNAFADDKASRRKLFYAIHLFNQDSYMKAINELDKLEAKCVTTADKVAVLMFQALNYTDAGFVNDAISTYNELVKYKNNDSTIFSNLGLLYMRAGNNSKAIEMFTKSIELNGSNSFAYSNLAYLNLNIGHPEKAVENALLALQYKSNLKEAMSTLSIAYKMLGDIENSKKYNNMYVLNGGSGESLHKVLENIDTNQNSCNV